MCVLRPLHLVVAIVFITRRVVGVVVVVLLLLLSLMLLHSFRDCCARVGNFSFSCAVC